MHYIRTQQGRKQSSGRLAFYSVLYYKFVMGIMKSLCSVAASTKVVSLLRHHRAKAYESFLIETPTEGGDVFPQKGHSEMN